jgi:hypothetical protein
VGLFKCGIEFQKCDDVLSLFALWYYLALSRALVAFLWRLFSGFSIDSSAILLLLFHLPFPVCYDYKFYVSVFYVVRILSFVISPTDSFFLLLLVGVVQSA